MKNRFIDLLIKKNRQTEKKALSDSFSIYPDSDPSKYNPWDDKPPRDDEEK